MSSLYTYNIERFADVKAFEQVCALILSKVQGVESDKLLEDVDGTLIRVIRTVNGKIKVLNDYDVDAVYVDSEIDLDEILPEFISP